MEVSFACLRPKVCNPVCLLRGHIHLCNSWKTIPEWQPVDRTGRILAREQMNSPLPLIQDSFDLVKKSLGRLRQKRLKVTESTTSIFVIIGHCCCIISHTLVSLFLYTVIRIASTQMTSQSGSVSRSSRNSSAKSK